MPITVSIPTIMRTLTGGEKRVQAAGSTLAEVIADLEKNYTGLEQRLLKAFRQGAAPSRAGRRWAWIAARPYTPAMRGPTPKVARSFRWSPCAAPRTTTIRGSCSSSMRGASKAISRSRCCAARSTSS